MITSSLVFIGHNFLTGIQSLGSSTLFILCALYNIVKPPFRFARIIKEVEFIGVKSFTIIFVTALFTGMVLALQGFHTLSKFGSESLLGSAVALSIVRELGPVLCALMVSGRAGSAVTAEIGIMKITDQIPALEMMAIDPVEYIVSPKVLAFLIALPILTAFFDIIGIFGGFLVGVKLLGVNEGAFFGGILSASTFEDVYGGIVKSLCFGLIIGWISTFIGYTAESTTEGVSSATTNTVVLASVAILVTDYILTSILF